jgi:CBS domain-containing protein
MVPELATVKEHAGMSETIEYMRAKGVWRVPVVNQSGGLVGILTLDDLLSLAKLVRHEQKKETLSRY